MSADFKSELTDLIPHMRAFARNLCGNATLADDMVQEAMLKAWKSRESYQEGSNIRAWVFTILRNSFYSDRRRAWRSQPLEQEVAEATLVSNDDADSALELLALRRAMSKLSEEHREALILVGAGGVPYEEAAEICGCAVGTIKSRVSRARKMLEELMSDGDLTITDSDLSANDVLADIIDEADSLQTQGS